jgi:hypothetical protein
MQSAATPHISGVNQTRHPDGGFAQLETVPVRKAEERVVGRVRGIRNTPFPGSTIFVERQSQRDSFQWNHCWKISAISF